MAKNLDLTGIQTIIDSFVEDYKWNLKGQNSVASGRLVNEAKGSLTYNDKTLTVYVTLPDHWKYVEYGRKAGKFPPIEDIREWIKVKPVLPRANGSLPTENQLAYLISRSIARNGIPAKNTLHNTLNDFQLEGKLIDAISGLLEAEIQKATEEIYE